MWTDIFVKNLEIRALNEDKLKYLIPIMIALAVIKIHHYNIDHY